MVNLNPDKPSTGALYKTPINSGHVMFDEPANSQHKVNWISTHNAYLMVPHSKTQSASRMHSLLHIHSVSIPVTACTKPKEALLLFKSQRHDDLPELNNDWVLRMVAPIILSSFLQLCKVQMGEPAHQQLQLFILEQT